MGNCRSCDTTAVAAPSTSSASTTAKLILLDGELQEFDSPVPVSNVLHKEPGYFVCNADDMEFDRHVSALSAGDVLQLGQLYFVLPRSMLGRPLQAEQMGALAVHASAALVKCCCHNGSVAPLVFADRATLLQGGREELRKMKRQQRAGSSGSRRSFMSTLNAIPEME